MARSGYYWVDRDEVLSGVTGKNADMTQKKLKSFLESHEQKSFDKLRSQAERYSSSPKKGKETLFGKLVDDKISRIERSAYPHREKVRMRDSAVQDVRDQGVNEIKDYFKEKVRKGDNVAVNKIVEEHQKNIANARKSISNEKAIGKKIAGKIKYLGGIDWKNDGADLAKDIVKDRRVINALGVTGAAAAAGLIGKKFIDHGKIKANDTVRKAVKGAVRKHYDNKNYKDKEEHEKKAMVIPEDYRTKTEKGIREAAGIILPAAAAIPVAVATTAVTSAGGEILRQRKRAKRLKERGYEERDEYRKYNRQDYRGRKRGKTSAYHV